MFEINTNGSGYAEIKDFSIEDSNGDNPDGANPRAVLVLSGGTFYGTTRYGGTAGQGTVFKMNSDGTGFTSVFSFNDVNPDSPIAALVVSDTTLYGTTPIGGNGFGSVFKINSNGTGFTNIHSFNGPDGNIPTAGLVLSGNTLYGATQNGGTGQGNLFQVNTDGSDYTNTHSFTGGSNGANPGAVLVLSGNTLYGTAEHGGSAGQGIVFKINTDHSGFTVLQNFIGTNSDGAGPGDLLLSGGALYGTTANGGTSDKGTVFQMDTTGNNFTVLKNFTGASDGANPSTTIVSSGNTLYGTTQNGGLSGYGTVFSLSLSSVVDLSAFRITAIAREANNLLVMWMMEPGQTNELQATTGGAGGSYNTNNFTAIFTVTNTVSTTTNYVDIGAATNFP